MTIVDNNVLSAFAKIERVGLLPEVFERAGTTGSPANEASLYAEL